MWRLFFRKCLYDGWDNLAGIVVLNILGVCPWGMAFGALATLGPSTASMIIIGGLSPLFAIHAVGAAHVLGNVADGKPARVTDYVRGLRSGWRSALMLCVICMLIVVFAWVALRFYATLSWPVGPIASGMVIWVVIMAVLVLQWFPAASHRYPGTIRARLRTCLLVAFDNPGASILLALLNALAVGLSLFTAFLLPGFSGAWLGTAIALKFRVRKYDWFRDHPDADRGAVPWIDLLREDDELTGHRTLKTMLFPWKH